MRRAFTLVEVLAVVGIVALVVAISFPVFAAAKRKGRESVCVSNMHQMQVAVMLYRAENEGSEKDYAPGMGLPTIFNLYRAVPDLRCPEINPAVDKVNYFYWPGFAGNTGGARWYQMVSQHGGASLLFSDDNHNDDDTRRKLLFPKLAFGVTLDGNLVRHTAPGDPTHPEWWFPETKEERP